MAVHLNRYPHSAFLVCWGRHKPSGWWGCVTLEVQLAGGQMLPVAAWVPAAALSRPGWARTEPIPRRDLPEDRLAWPAPPKWPAWYAGPWLDGPLTLPAGSTPDDGPAWRTRRGRR